MIPPEVAYLKDALIAIGATNSDEQAIKWANQIIESLDKHDYIVTHLDNLDGG